MIKVVVVVVMVVVGRVKENVVTRGILCKLCSFKRFGCNWLLK